MAKLEKIIVDVHAGHGRQILKIVLELVLVLNC
jgi:hypothetical protein